MTEPRCSTSHAAEIVDVVFAALDGVTIGTELAAEHRTDNDTAAIVLAVAESIVHLASAHSGDEWVEQCKKAQHVWDRRGIDHKPEVAPAAIAPSLPPSPRPLSVAPTFVCYASPRDGNLGFCARTTRECNDRREIDLSTIADLETCAPASAARCFTYDDPVDHAPRETCAPNAAACNKRREPALGVAGNVSECREAR